MKKEKSYYRTVFTSQVIHEADASLESILPAKREAWEKEPKASFRVPTGPNEKWKFDSLAEFLAAYKDQGTYGKNLGDYALDFYSNGEHSVVEISAPTRAEIEIVSGVFEKHAEACKLPGEDISAFTIFIGHGHSDLWKELKDHLRDQHHMNVQAYEIGSRAGHSVRDILEEMLDDSSMALLIMTGEDRLEDGKLNPRLNVVHETGLFQGRLGFPRAIVLLEDGTEEFSNIQGIHQIRFKKGNIRETFGDVVATIRREFEEEHESED